jgi:hypothetical protein
MSFQAKRELLVQVVLRYQALNESTCHERQCRHAVRQLEAVVERQESVKNMAEKK